MVAVNLTANSDKYLGSKDRESPVIGHEEYPSLVEFERPYYLT